MSDCKWTRGPWYIGKYGKVKGAGMTESSFESICVAGMTLSSGREAEANAHLIAAAPDLYKALEDAVFQMEKVCGQCEQWIDWTEAKDALRKARGEVS